MVFIRKDTQMLTYAGKYIRYADADGTFKWLSYTAQNLQEARMRRSDYTIVTGFAVLDARGAIIRVDQTPQTCNEIHQTDADPSADTVFNDEELHEEEENSEEPVGDVRSGTDTVKLPEKLFGDEQP